MPKIISAMILWYLNKTHELGALFDSWYHDNEDLAQLVDKGITDHHASLSSGCSFIDFCLLTVAHH